MVLDAQRDEDGLSGALGGGRRVLEVALRRGCLEELGSFAAITSAGQSGWSDPATKIAP
jgi:hypothetical protein